MNEVLRFLDGGIVAGAAMDGRLEHRDAAEPPGVGDDFVRQQEFERTLGLERFDKAGAKGVVFGGVLVGEHDVAADEAMLQGIGGGAGLAGGGAGPVLWRALDWLAATLRSVVMGAPVDGTVEMRDGQTGGICGLGSAAV